MGTLVRCGNGKVLVDYLELELPYSAMKYSSNNKHTPPPPDKKYPPYV